MVPTEEEDGTGDTASAHIMGLAPTSNLHATSTKETVAAKASSCTSSSRAVATLCEQLGEEHAVCQGARSAQVETCSDQAAKVQQDAATQLSEDADDDGDVGESAGRRGGGAFLSTTGSFTLSS